MARRWFVLMVAVLGFAFPALSVWKTPGELKAQEGKELSGDIAAALKDIQDEYDRHGKAMTSSEATPEERMLNVKLIGEKLKTIIELDPSNEDALALMSKLNTAMVLDLLEEGGTISEYVNELNRRAALFQADLDGNPEKIREKISELKNADVRKMHTIADFISFKHGAYAVPFILEGVGEGQTNTSSLIVCLRRIGRRATLPLLASLSPLNKDYTQMAVSINTLKSFGDPRALGDLQRLAESASLPETIRGAAKEAVAEIQKQNDIKPAKAVEHYLRQAHKYHMGEFELMREAGSLRYWHWESEGDPKVQGEIIPGFTHNDRVSEQFCYRALELEPENITAWSLLNCVFMAQFNEGRLALALADEKKVRNPEMEIPEEIKALKTRTDRLRNLALASGVKKLYSGLKLALMDERYDIAVELIDGIAETETAAGFTAEATGAAEPLIRSLTHSDNRVRFAAAHAILRVSPRKDFPDSDKVIGNLQAALGLTAQRVILVVSDNRDFINTMRFNISKYLGHHAIGAEDREAAFREAGKAPSEDIIVVDSRMPLAVMTLQDLRKDYRTKDTPTLLYANLKSDENDKITALIEDFKDAGGNSFPRERVILGTDASAYETITQDIFKNHNLDTARQKAWDMAAKTANLVADAAAKSSMFDFNKLAETLKGNLSSQSQRPPEVIIPSARALAAIGDPSVIKVMTTEFADDSRHTVESREAIGMAILEIMRKREIAPTEAVGAAKTVLANGDPKLQLVAGKILGAAGLESGISLELLKDQRPQEK